MNGRVGLLSALLGLQLVVIAAVLLLDSGLGKTGAGPLLDFSPTAVNEVRIGTEDDDGAVVITRGENGWQLADGLPADGVKVDEILERLAGLQAPWPVATSAGARERFEVAEKNHQRHVVLEADGTTVADLYLGTSPGYQRVHARRADSGDVYSVALSNYQVPAKAEDWLDKMLLQPHGDVAVVERVGAWRLFREGEGWQLDAGVVNPEAADQLVRRISELRVTGTAAEPADGSEAAAEFRVQDADGTFTLMLYGADDGDPYTVTSDRRKGYFGLAGYLAAQLLVDRAALTAAAPADGDAPEGAAVDGAAR